jgi:hypothetical protein
VTDPIAKHLRTAIDAYGDAWGFQWRRNFGDCVRIDLPCTLGRLFQGTSGEYEPKQYPEVFLGMGQKFAHALKRMPERHIEMAFAQYVIHAHVTRKAAALGLEKSGYYWRLDSMRAAMCPLLLGESDFNWTSAVDNEAA